ncbi:MAG TPA: leucyl/phenylalanyl-tRNA--protein transferase [Thermoanaerobaculia bacterium]
MRRQELHHLAFPDPRWADDYGLVALGGDYRPERLLAAYACGIFPWPSEGLPHAWFSPNPRLVLRPDELCLSRSLRKTLRKGRFRVTYDLAFDDVIRHCAAASRPNGAGTWLTPELVRGLRRLHRLGFAHSVESWRGDELAGGLYGVSLGTLFCGESMFFRQRDASKVALVHLAERLRSWGFRMIDCQVHTDHLARLGAREWPRDRFLDELGLAVREPTRRGPWTDQA